MAALFVPGPFAASTARLTRAQNPQNWRRPKKLFVTFEVCFLTFSVYIGSAIYSAGIQGVMQEFGVSQVAATLGLTLFVTGLIVGSAGEHAVL